VGPPPSRDARPLDATTQRRVGEIPRDHPANHGMRRGQSWTLSRLTLSVVLPRMRRTSDLLRVEDPAPDWAPLPPASGVRGTSTARCQIVEPNQVTRTWPRVSPSGADPSRWRSPTRVPDRE
jgi:hypothetical protein